MQGRTQYMVARALCAITQEPTAPALLPLDSAASCSQAIFTRAYWFSELMEAKASTLESQIQDPVIPLFKVILNYDWENFLVGKLPAWRRQSCSYFWGPVLSDFFGSFFLLVPSPYLATPLPSFLVLYLLFWGLFLTPSLTPFPPAF